MLSSSTVMIFRGKRPENVPLVTKPKVVKGKHCKLLMTERAGGSPREAEIRHFPAAVTKPSKIKWPGGACRLRFHLRPECSALMLLRTSHHRVIRSYAVGSRRDAALTRQIAAEYCYLDTRYSIDDMMRDTRRVIHVCTLTATTFG